MKYRFSKTEEVRVQNKLVRNNIRRVLLSALVCAVMLPFMILINKYSGFGKENSTYRSMLYIFEIFSIVSAATAFYMMRERDVKMGRTLYRSFWLLFELFSFTIIYMQMYEGASLSFYPIMLAALMLVPIMNITEQLYYLVIQTVFITVMYFTFDTKVFDLLNILLMNVVFFTVSRLQTHQFVEKLMLDERQKDISDNTVHDRMTGLLNKRGFDRAVNDAIISCIKTRRRVSAIIVDIDDLRIYNESFGSDRGNLCIREVADIVKNIALRNTDIICRMDAGRFLIYMEGGNDMEPVMMAEKIRSVVEGKRIPQGRRSRRPFLTVSAGVASCMPKHESDFREIYDEAETAMFEAKEHGKNNTVYEDQLYSNAAKVSGYRY